MTKPIPQLLTEFSSRRRVFCRSHVRTKITFLKYTNGGCDRKSAEKQYVVGCGNASIFASANPSKSPRDMILAGKPSTN